MEPEVYPCYSEMTNADVFALTRLRRVQACAERRAILFGKYGPTQYGKRAVAEFIVQREAERTPPTKRARRSIRRATEDSIRWLAFRSEESFTPRLKLIRDLQGNCCYLCADAFTAENGPTVDHVMPRSRGGRNRGNILLAHSRCNGEKSDRPPTERERAYLSRINFALTNSQPLTLDCVKSSFWQTLLGRWLLGAVPA